MLINKTVKFIKYNLLIDINYGNNFNNKKLMYFHQQGNKCK